MVKAIIKAETSEEDHYADLCDAILLLETPDEARAFLTDLCTPAEKRALSERWHVAKLLDQGNHSYREIYQLSGVSTTTIGRVARFMTDEPYQGYALILKRQNENSKNDKTSQNSDSKVR